MDKKKLEKLVEKLGMKHELQPLFDSDTRAYARFEKTITNIFNNYERNEKGTCPMVRKWEGYKEKQHAPNPPTNFVRIQNFSEAIIAFEDYYGINGSSRSFTDISKDIPSTHYAQDKHKTQEWASKRVKFITAWLSQNHKSDIWYGTL